MRMKMENEASERTRLVRLFCAPPPLPPSDNEVKALEKTERFEVPFGERALPCYAWGAGPPVLLCHGWGSRAGHLALLGRVLAHAGFRAVAFDAPGHRSLPGQAAEDASSMFAFGRAAAAAARSLGGVHGLAGHSLGAMAALFALAGAPPLEDCAFRCRKLALLAAPATLSAVIGNFCRRQALDDAGRALLERGLEAAFSMSIARYDCARALDAIDADVLLVQDEDDAEFPPEGTLARAAAGSSARVFLTAGLGHDRILASRPVFTEIIGFMRH
jgi:pimeloyl-ACP methyl ester carboxylesterase